MSITMMNTKSLLILLTATAFASTSAERGWWSRTKSQVSDNLKSPSYLRHLSACETVKVDFDDLTRGEYVSNQYATYGLILSATGGYGVVPRAFDTSKPGTAEDGDPDLGSPHILCNPSGPGIGSGGRPGSPGENCVPQGNVLIIEEDGVGDNPDDNQVLKAESVAATIARLIRYTLTLSFSFVHQT